MYDNVVAVMDPSGHSELRVMDTDLASGALYVSVCNDLVHSCPGRECISLVQPFIRKSKADAQYTDS